MTTPQSGLAALTEAAREPLLDNLYAEERARMLPYDERVEFPYEKLGRYSVLS